MRLRQVALCALLPAAAFADSVFFVDNAKGGYLRAEHASRRELTAQGNAAVAAALAGIAPPFHIDHSVSAEVNDVLSPHVFDRPEAVLSVQVGGVDEGDLAALKFPFSSVSAPLREAGESVKSALSGLSSVQIAECETECDEACLKGSLGELPEALDASQPSVHAFLVELACFARSVTSAGSAATGIVTAHLSGFRELAAAHARGSSAYAAAAELLSKTLSAAVQRFHDAHGGKAATQVTFVSAEEEEEEEAKVTLHQAAGRMLIKGENDGPSAAAMERDVKQWHAKVAALGTGVLMAATTAAGIICLCSMPTGQDSLLYVRQKED